jgi:hypothetical protein
MDQPPNESLDPLSLLIRSFQAAVRTAESGTRPAPEYDAAALLRQWLATMGGLWSGATVPWAGVDGWARSFSSPEGAFDPIGSWVRWYTANSDAMAAALDQVLRAPAFIRASARALDDYATSVAAQRRAAELAARNLPFATHADVARLAQLVIGVEAKVEQLLDEDQLEADRRQGPGAVGEVSVLAARLDRLEAKVDRLVAALTSDSLAEPVSRRRSSADSGRTQPAAHATATRSSGTPHAATQTPQPRVRLVRGAKTR